MVCNRFQRDGMRLLDGEMNDEEKALYEAHVNECEGCREELKEMGRVVDLTSELKLREPDEEFWEAYWSKIFRRLERGTGFFFVSIGILALIVIGIVRAVTSPQFFTFTGLSIAVVLIGLIIVFISVVRERYHESKSDPYRRIKR